jgi:hypothetical protein
MIVGGCVRLFAITPFAKRTFIVKLYLSPLEHDDDDDDDDVQKKVVRSQIKIKAANEKLLSVSHHSVVCSGLLGGRVG